MTLAAAVLLVQAKLKELNSGFWTTGEIEGFLEEAQQSMCTRKGLYQLYTATVVDTDREVSLEDEVLSLKRLIYTNIPGTAFEALHAYLVGDLVKPTTANGFGYTCSTAGTSGATEPTWGTTINGETTSGGAKFLAYEVSDDEIVLVEPDEYRVWGTYVRIYRCDLNGSLDLICTRRPKALSVNQDFEIPDHYIRTGCVNYAVSSCMWAADSASGDRYLSLFNIARKEWEQETSNESTILIEPGERPEQ